MNLARPFVALGFVLLALGPSLASSAAPQIRYRTVALSGQAAPGTPAGVNHADFGLVYLNDVGQVAYSVRLAGSGVTTANDSAIYAGSFAAPQLVAREGDAAPGTPLGVNYSRLDPPILNDAGQVAYYAELTGSGGTTANNQAIYAGPPAAPQLVARSGDPAPGMPPGVNHVGFRLTSLNDIGQAAYHANLIGNGVTNANNGAIYAGPFAAPQLVAREGDAAPGTPPGVNYSLLITPTLNDGGQVAYSVRLAGSGVTTANDRAIYAGPFTAAQLVAREGDAAPGTPPGVNYSFLDTLTLNDVGQVAYMVVLAGNGVTDANDLAIYAGSFTAPQFVAREGDAAPGTPPGVNYWSFSTPALNDAGQVAYYADLAGSGVTTANNQAIYAGSPAAPQLVARSGDPAPGTPAGVNYSSLFISGFHFKPAFNNGGQAAYYAELTGSGVTEANDLGLFANDPALGGLLIAREGDVFDVGGGDFRTIAQGILFMAGRSDDEPTGLSNNGTLAFSLRFTDGTSGVFTATIIPEPGALPLLAAAITLLGVRKRGTFHACSALDLQLPLFGGLGCSSSVVVAE